MSEIAFYAKEPHPSEFLIEAAAVAPRRRHIGASGSPANIPSQNKLSVVREVLKSRALNGPGSGANVLEYTLARVEEVPASATNGDWHRGRWAVGSLSTCQLAVRTTAEKEN